MALNRATKSTPEDDQQFVDAKYPYSVLVPKDWQREFYSFPLTAEQRKITEYFHFSPKSFIIEALAGSGKTTILRHLTYMFRNPSSDNDNGHENNSVTYLAFGKEFALSAREKFSCFPHVNQVLTTHQWGYRIIRNSEPNTKHVVTGTKQRVESIAETLGWSKPWDLARLKTLASWWRNSLCDPDDTESILKTADAFANLTITKEVLTDFLHTGIRYKTFKDLCMHRSSRLNAFSHLVDFDDMLQLETTNLQIKPGDLFLIDEFQDFNPAQLLLVDKILLAGARVVVVGDPHQAIYAFRSGVRYNALEKFASIYDFKVFPMTISQRSPIVGAILASSIVKDYKFADDAINGQAFCIHDRSTDGLHAYYNQLVEEKQISGSNPLLVVARVNSVLINHAMNLLVRGVPFYYRGDVAKKLQSAIMDIQKMEQNSERPLDELLDSWLFAKLKKIDPKRRSTVQFFEEMHECLMVLASPLPEDATANDLLEQLNRLLNQETKRGSCALELHTVHSVKGMEADHVFLAGTNLFPHPMAAQPWEKEQEMNILYVALTRFKKRLVTDQHNYLIDNTGNEALTPLPTLKVDVKKLYGKQ